MVIFCWYASSTAQTTAHRRTITSKRPVTTVESFIFLTSERWGECEHERANYKHNAAEETAREKGGKRVKKRQWCWEKLGQRTRFQTQNLRKAARHEERAQTISANTNMGNGSKMEFTRAHCKARLAKKTVSLNQAEWQQRRGSKFLLQSTGRPRPGSQSEGSKHAGRFHTEEWMSTTSARFSGQIVWRSCWTMNLKLKRNVRGVVICMTKYVWVLLHREQKEIFFPPGVQISFKRNSWGATFVLMAFTIRLVFQNFSKFFWKRSWIP